MGTNKKHKLGIPILWDFVMVFVVLGNLGLIIFDLSYLTLRPYYFHNFPKIVEMYDKPILGIEPHRMTSTYTEFVDDLNFLTKLRNEEFREEERVNVIHKISSLLTGLKGQISSERFDQLLVDFNNLRNLPDPNIRRKKTEDLFLQMNELLSVMEETDQISEFSELN